MEFPPANRALHRANTRGRTYFKRPMRSHPFLLGAPRVRSGATLARAGTDARVNYVALGDSSAVGVGAREGGYPARLARRLRAEGADVDLMNLGVSGATSADVLRGQL